MSLSVAYLSPKGSDAEILYNMAPWLDFNVDWLQIKNTPAKKFDSAKEYLRGKQGSNFDAQHKIKDVDLLNLNREQLFAANIMEQNMDSQILMIIMGGPGTGKSTAVKSVTKIVNETVQISMPVIRLGTTGTDYFVISGDTCNSVLIWPTNSPLQDLRGAKIKFLQYHLD